MSNKQAVLEAVRKISDDASMEEILEELAILAAIRRGEQAADAGDVITQEEFQREVAQWSLK